ncbi:MAG: shikimate kinase [Chthoniobacterales bacterium]|nr:shikimate kinase [Chthoniobacterales bacterium]
MAQRGAAIVLIGFMGTGKSSVGRALAQRTGLSRYDTDQMVMQRFGVSIAEIFARCGETAFRDAEVEALEQIPRSRAIIVTGGGIVLRSQNVETIRRLGVVVNLVAAFDTLMERLQRRSTRPLLQTENPRATALELLRVRQPLYESAADVTVDTSALTHDEVADEILSQTEEIRRGAI